MFQLDIEIKHTWYLETEFHSPNILKPYSASFANELLPDVKFYIFCSELNDKTCKLVLSRTPPRPAKATVQILLQYPNRKDKIYDYPWIDVCTLECDFPPNELDFIYYTYTCCITWCGFNESKRSVYGDLYSHLKNFLTVPDLRDTMIIIDENKIPVHKIILAAYSPVFLAIFKTDMTESANNQIIITDIEVDIMQKVVEFMYTGTINSVPKYDSLFSILKAADNYEIKDLKVLCEEKLFVKITVENVLEILEKSSLYGGPLLAKSVSYFMVKNKLSIIKLEDFEDFLLKKPQLLAKFIIHVISNDNNVYE